MQCFHMLALCQPSNLKITKIERWVNFLYFFQNPCNQKILGITSAISKYPQRGLTLGMISCECYKCLPLNSHFLLLTRTFISYKQGMKYAKCKGWIRKPRAQEKHMAKRGKFFSKETFGGSQGGRHTLWKEAQILLSKISSRANLNAILY